ncbi:MAG: aminodeoxychorismate lyase [Chromatiales bacterium]|jgi:4-amino-4-deoxychorismate lyase|nr:aminodeoxychorismate lyase [Chromatiales bacterium]
MSARILVNGLEARTVPADDRGLAYGDGLFETLALREGGVRFVEAHLARLARGCARLAIPMPDGGLLRTQLAAVSDGVAHGVVKIVLTRGPGPRGYAPPASPEPTLIVSCHPGEPRSGIAAPLRVRDCATPVASSPALAGLKTLNRLEQVLARAEWRDPAIGEGLMRDEAGWYAGGTASNLFVVRDGTLLTPGLGRRGVRGIMRDAVLAASARLGIASAEADLGRADLDGATEMFLTSALIGIAPVGEFDGRRLATGPVTRRLRAELALAGVGECAAPL